ncbi:MAG TPA: cyanophycinase [Gemmatimonadaceae bacterium]|nr:cyanophycinase [Gemmatimonadaceae bacterium]
MRRLTTLALTSLLAACAASATRAPSPGEASGAVSGHLVIVGGGPIPESVDRRFLDLAGGAGKARIVVLPMASESGTESGAAKAASYVKLGAANAVSLNLTRADVNADSVARLLGQATGIWFPGGDQNRLTAAILGTPVLDSIRARYRHGAVVGGTSAGAAVMSDPMIGGDERRPGGARRDTTDNWMTIDRDDVILVPGFGLLPNVTVDQHFLRRRRHNRLISVTLERPTVVGVGIDESTALVVSPTGPWEVIGASQAIVYDARRSTLVRGTATLGAADIRVHVLPAGSRFDLATGTATLP